VLLFYLLSVPMMNGFWSDQKSGFYAEAGYNYTGLGGVDTYARFNLYDIAKAEAAYFSEAKKWGKTFSEIGYEHSPGLNIIFLNSCEEVIQNYNEFKKCPEALKEYFKKNPFSETDGYHAAAVFNPAPDRGGWTRIWVIDKGKNRQSLGGERVFPSIPPALIKRRFDTTREVELPR
jgi:hypothetical protein